ncbi:hypothetical protein MXC99_01935 [Thauera aromatica]|uniref:hypothetical protein n=1 Tax=Thauera aromatica TaxID=59405 RepID=UPI001FFC7100|nr:hypothetical protein [Thauera aromatica]MCK2086949.1 hypothetical protein [Thauera aromatica]
MDIKTLEHHHNALLSFVNCLVIALASESPQVVWKALAQMREALDETPEIPPLQRKVMERLCQGFTDVMTDQSRGG